MRETYGAALEDLRPERLPDLQWYAIAETEFVDAATAPERLGLSSTYRSDVPHPSCQGIAEAAYADGEAGIAALAAVAPAEEKLAVFDRAVAIVAREGRRRRFNEWFFPSALPE